MGGGMDEAVKVVDLEDGEGEEEAAAAAAAEGPSKETRMLPRMPVRVLLAEGDDSTRHVISALLRKCGYRVAAASDGVKAWNILKEKSFHIDLVLTEVELPLMSGFLLLSTIMEHDAAKNIPVIMMSSHDSANGGSDVQHIQQEEDLTERIEQQIAVTKADNLNKDGPTANNLIPTREDDLSPKKKTCLNNFDKASRDIELVHIIDNQQKHNMQMEVDTVTASIGNDEKGSIPAHQLELSLRTDYGKLESDEKNDRRMLNHSTSSAFSFSIRVKIYIVDRYNCRTASALGNAGDGLTFDGQPFWNGTPVASLFYSQSAPPIWNSKTSMWQESTPQKTSLQQKSQQTEPNEMGPKAVENTEEQSVIISRPNSSGKQLRVEIPRDEARHVSPMTGESGTSTVLDSARNNLSGSGSGCDSNSNRITAPTESSNTFNGVPETPGTEGSRHLSQREAALNKFRLKRKDRFGTKVGNYSQSSVHGSRASLFVKIIASKEAKGAATTLYHTAG
nr:unnamed protein product [Digitaria exilis]